MSNRVESPLATHLFKAGLGQQLHNETLRVFNWRNGMTAYVTATRVAKVSSLLSSDDWVLLKHLATVKLLSGRQLYRVMGATDSTSQRQLRRQLRELGHRQIIAALNRRIGGVRGGSDSYVYALDILGQRLLDRAPRRQWRRPWTPSLRNLQHLLAVAELYALLVEADQSGELELESFSTEPACWRSFVGPGGARMIFKPDAHVIVSTDELELHAWIEMDMATESLAWITEKAKTYGRYYATGKEQARHGVFPKALWITPDHNRAKGLVHALSRLPADHWQLHQVTTCANTFDALLAQAQQHHLNGEPRP